MNIFVLVKQVPVISDIHIDHETFTVDRSSAGALLNPVDLNAIEAALALRASQGGSVTVLTMGSENTEPQLREAIGMGADRAVRLTDEAFSGADTLVTAQVLSAAIRHLGPADCIFCGHTSLDSATGQIGGKIASILKFKLLSSVCEIKDDEHGLTVRKKAGTGYEIWQADFPLVCSVTEDVNAPRMVTLRGKAAAKKAEITVLNKNDIGLTEESFVSPSKVEALFPAPKQEIGTIIKGNNEKETAKNLADILFEKHLI